MVTGKQIRLSRLFGDGGWAVVVAIDHGQTFGPMERLEDFGAVVARLKTAGGVLLVPQMVRFTGVTTSPAGSTPAALLSRA